MGNGNSSALAVQTSTLEFTPEQRKLIRDTYANGANDSEFGVLMEIAKARNLNPLKRQIWFTKRWDSMKKCDVWAPMVSIDGLRCIAERTGRYDGQDQAEFTYDNDGKIFSAVVRVYRKGIPRPFATEVFYSEFVQLAKDKDSGNWRPNAMWAKMPHSQLAKCAEAASLRKGFPEDTAGLYIDEELSTEAQEKDVTPPSGGTAESVKAKLARRLGTTAHAPTASAPQLPAQAPAPEPASGRRLTVVDEAKPTIADRLNALLKKKGGTKPEFKTWAASVLQSDKDLKALTEKEMTYLEEAFAATQPKPKAEELTEDDIPF